MAEQDSFRELQRVVIKEELYKLTGDHYKAAVLNTLIFWHGIVNKNDKNTLSKIESLEKRYAKQPDKKLLKEINNLKKELRHGWFYKTGKELTHELMGWGSPSTVTRTMQYFEEKEWIQKGNNPDPRAKWDRTSWYRVNIKNIAKDLHELGYALEGYPLIQEEQIEENPVVPKTQEQEEQPIKQKNEKAKKNSKKKEQETNIELNNLVCKNQSFHTLLWFCDRQQFLNNKKDFEALINKLLELNCVDFEVEDIFSAHSTVREKLLAGDKISHLAHYFATILYDAMDKRKMKEQYEQEKNKLYNKNPEIKANKELLFYDWLGNSDEEEDNEVSNF